MPAKATNQFWRFTFAGALGFVIELTMVGLLTKSGWAPLSARALSFPLASFFTWLVNRRLAFWDERARHWRDVLHEYKRYLSGQLVGALTNLLVFTLLVIGVPRIPVLSALSVAALFGLIVNFFLARALVFRRRHD